MSRTFSMNSGSSEILKDSTTCGCNPKVRQMRPTVEALTPARSAILRVLQWVRPFGLLSNVATRIDSTSASDSVRGGSGLGLVIQRIHATCRKPLPPLADRHIRTAQFRRDRHVRFAMRAPQDDLRPQGHMPIRSGAPGEPLKFSSLHGGDFQSRFGPTCSCHAAQYITPGTLLKAFSDTRD